MERCTLALFPLVYEIKKNTRTNVKRLRFSCYFSLNDTKPFKVKSATGIFSNLSNIYGGAFSEILNPLSANIT